MNLNNIHNVFLIGIGGIGMSALARYFKQQNLSVSGYDKTKTSLTNQLEQEGMSIHYDDSIALIEEKFRNRENTLVIYTPAIPKSHSQLNYFIENKFELHKRAKVLGYISKKYNTIAISGTHGKTTISSMLAHILFNSDLGCNAFLGGITVNYNTNFMYSPDSKYMVVEADEYDRSFLNLTPGIALISALDADHLDIYGRKEEMEKSFQLFANQIEENGFLLIKKKISEKIKVKNNIKTHTYSLKEKACYYAKNIRIENDFVCFSLQTPKQTITGFKLQMQGNVNIENAVAATALALIAGTKPEQVKKSLAGFKGIKRRFEYRINSNKIIYIDDYAHHPEELRAVIESVKEIYPGKKITGIFQPHLFSRTRDFATEFAQSLDLLHQVILLDIYPARELPIKGVTAKIIFDKINIQKKHICTIEKVFDYLDKLNQDILLTLGAGNIDQLVLPIEKYLLKKHNLQHN